MRGTTSSATTPLSGLWACRFTTKSVTGNIYPGVDLVYYGTQGQLEYDFVVASGADPGSIALDFEGVSRLTVTPDGDLLLETPTGDICQRKPVVYQETEDCRREVGGHYVCAGGQRVGFQVGL